MSTCYGKFSKLKFILESMMQGGGFEKLQFDKAPSISSTVPMEVVVSQLFIRKG